MKIAIVGLPQSGKKTLFSLLTQRQVPLHLGSKEIVEGKSKLKDKRVDEIAKICHPQRIVYAETSFLLCPDIDPNNREYSWLSEARLCDLVCLVVRGFESEEVYHPKGNIDVERDIEDLKLELIFADLELAEKRLERLSKDKRVKKLTLNQERELISIEKCKQCLEEEKPLSQLEFFKEDFEAIRSLNFITLKPLLWCVNVGENNILAFEKKYENQDDRFVVSALIEKEIQSIENEEERNSFMLDLGLKESGVNRLNERAYDWLGLMSFYTMGKDEARAWTIKKKTLAPEAGGKIHSDIQRGFIRVEVIKYDDLLKAGSEQSAKTDGKMQVKGKDYVIEDGDICNFLFNI